MRDYGRPGARRGENLISVKMSNRQEMGKKVQSYREALGKKQELFREGGKINSYSRSSPALGRRASLKAGGQGQRKRRKAEKEQNALGQGAPNLSPDDE